MVKAMSFDKVAPYLQDPLVLIGFVLLLFFSLSRSVLKAGIIPVLSGAAGYRIVTRLLLYGFILSLVVIAVGFVLKYQELSEKEQRAAVKLLHQELAGDLRTIEELRKNIENITRNTAVVTDVLRHPGIPLLLTLFPQSNIDPDTVVPASFDLARTQLAQAKSSGLLDDKVEREKFNQAAQAIVGTISRTIGAIESLADVAGTRYQIKSDVWNAHLPILRKVHVVNVSEVQKAYQSMTLIRTNYSVSVDYCIKYLRQLNEFFSDSDVPISSQRLAALLAAERIYLTTADQYVETVKKELSVLAIIVSRVNL